MAKTKLTEEVIKTAVKYIALGTPVKYICDALMISEVTWYAWFNEGEKAQDDRKLTTKFFKSVKKAKGDMIARNLKHIEQAADNGTWTAAAWKLERLDPENFGKKDNNTTDGGLRDLAEAIRGIK